MYRRILSAVAGLLLMGSGLALAASSYTQVFDVAPLTPEPARPLVDWDVLVHSDNINPATWLMVPGSPMQASHGTDCGAPPATHLMGTYDDAVFFCKNHVMTSLFADGGYGVIYLTPPELLDFSAGEAVIRWDMSTLRTSLRDWVDLWVTPYADRLPMPLEDWLPDLQGPPRTAFHLRMDNNSIGTMFRPMVVSNFVTTELPSGDCCLAYEQVLTPDAARRDTFELHLSRTHVKYGLPAYNLWWMDSDVPDLGFDSGVVQFGHHSYNPLKDCPASQTCASNTWHWDNVTLTSAIPFTIGKVSPRAVSDQGNGPLTFDAPAPAGAMLQFQAFGGAVQVSWDGGVTWSNAPAAPEEEHRTDRFDGYLVPAPEGATTAQVRATGGWWGSQWQARDFSVWSQVGVPRTPTPTPAPSTPTATPVPPTATVTPFPTATPGPTRTPLPSPTTPPTPTPAAQPTATPTAGVQCELVSIINGALVNTPQAPTACPQS